MDMRVQFVYNSYFIITKTTIRAKKIIMFNMVHINIFITASFPVSHRTPNPIPLASPLCEA